MRENLLLHFLNRDSREIYGLYTFYDDREHYRILRRALNVAAMLCEDHCVLPPGFILEDDIAFDLAESQRAYLEKSILRFPIRESNLADYAEKKRGEYSPMRDRYSGLFNDTRVEFLGRNALGLIQRKTKIAEQISNGWQSGIDTKLGAWQPVKKSILPSDVEAVRNIPARLASEGVAVTWSAIQPYLPLSAKPTEKPLRNALQHVYLKQYCREFDLVIISSIPQMIEEFYLPRKPLSYSYQRFLHILEVFGAEKILSEASSELILALRNTQGFIRFIDAYVQLAEQFVSLTDLRFAALQIERSCRFEWARLRTRFVPFVQEPNDLEIRELDDAFSEAAGKIAERHGIVQRSGEIDHTTPGKLLGDVGEARMPDLVLFVALEEELAVLTKALSLKRNPSSPAAEGTLNGNRVAILCPRDMGRVPAAVEVTRYLEGRKGALPQLILIVGLAGGFPEQGTKPGHIICATDVVDLAHRKVIERKDGGAQAKFRRKDFDLDLRLRDVLLSDAFDKKAWIDATEETAEWPDDRKPSITYGRLASVDEVIASTDWSKQLMEHTEKLLGIEMEAGGVCAAARQFQVPVSMLRAVSDNADPAKADDNWRKVGMKSIAELLKAIPMEQIFRKK